MVLDCHGSKNNPGQTTENPISRIPYWSLNLGFVANVQKDSKE